MELINDLWHWHRPLGCQLEAYMHVRDCMDSFSDIFKNTNDVCNCFCPFITKLFRGQRQVILNRFLKNRKNIVLNIILFIYFFSVFFLPVHKESFLGCSWVLEQSEQMPCLYRLRTDVLLSTQRVGDDGMVHPRKLKSEFMTFDLNLWTGVHWKMLCNSLDDFKCSDDTAVTYISVSLFYYIN